MSDVFTSRSKAPRDYALERLAEQWKRDHQRQLENLLPGHFFPGQSPLIHVAMWALKTKKISPAVLYLASGLDKIYETFRSEDTACLASDTDQAEFARLMQLNKGSSGTAIEAKAAGQYAATAAQLAMGARTYRSHAVWDGDPKCEWHCSFVLPERFHVTQAGAGDFDEWITIRADHYWNLGFWIGPMVAETVREESVESLRRREKLNAFLRIDKVCTILSQFPIMEASGCEQQGLTYAVLAYGISPAARVPEIKTWLGDEEPEPRELEVEIWISLASGFPVKARLKSREFDWCQVFVGFDEVIEIEAPNATPNQPDTS